MTETMTAEDAALVGAYASGANVWMTKTRALRIAATYHALAASQQEVERLTQENMALGTENRMLWGDVERLRRENALLRAGAPLPPPAPTTLTADTDYAARRDSGEGEG